MLFGLYLILINLLATILCSYDKTQARIQGKRISESNLFLVSIIGGSPAMYFTMHIIHHKTRKKKFTIGIPLIMALQILIICLFLLR